MEPQVIIKVFVTSIVLAACGCPAGENVADRYTNQRDAVISAVNNLGYDTDVGMMYGTTIVYRDLEGIQADCDGNHSGCFCEDVACPGSIILREADLFKPGKNCTLQSSKSGGCWDTAEETALHEYVHAALKYSSLHLNTADHPPVFWKVWQEANKVYNK